MSMNREFTLLRTCLILSLIILGTASCGLKFGADARQASENTSKNNPKPAFVEMDNTKPEPKTVKAKSIDLKDSQTKTKPADKMATAETAVFVRSGKNRRIRRTTTHTETKKVTQQSKTPIEVVKGEHQKARNAVRTAHEKVLVKLGIKQPKKKKVLYPTVQLFGARLNESKWLLSSTELECLITQPIPRLGRAIFTYNPVQKLQFIFEVNHPPARNLEVKDKRYAQNLMTDKYPYPSVGAKLESIPPDWKPFSIKKMLGYIPFQEGSQPFVLPHRKRLLATEQSKETKRKGSKKQFQVASLTTANFLPEIWPDRLMSELEEGMTFTIEPGIYLAGRGGVRIEDDVVITKDGVHSFSKLPRELKIL